MISSDKRRLWRPAQRKCCGDVSYAPFLSPRGDMRLWFNGLDGGLVIGCCWWRPCRGERPKASLVQPCEGGIYVQRYKRLHFAFDINIVGMWPNTMISEEKLWSALLVYIYASPGVYAIRMSTYVLRYVPCVNQSLVFLFLLLLSWGTSGPFGMCHSKTSLTRFMIFTQKKC